MSVAHVVWFFCLQSVGHSYSLLDLNTGSALNVEVGPGGAASAAAFSPGSWYFHANMYKHLVVEQVTDDSSYHREVRALQLQVRLWEGEVGLAGLLGLAGCRWGCGLRRPTLMRSFG
jgi:hypothetical protein